MLRKWIPSKSYEKETVVFTKRIKSIFFNQTINIFNLFPFFWLVSFIPSKMTFTLVILNFAHSLRTLFDSLISVTFSHGPNPTLDTMGKKSAFTKSSVQTKNNKNLFNVKKVTHKKKSKAVKTNVKKVYIWIDSNSKLLCYWWKKHLYAFQMKANVKKQQERVDDSLKTLHEKMVTKTPPKNKKIDLKLKKTKNTSSPDPATIQTNLEKMNV